jgi:uncharacterized protein (DUF1501 family)
MLDHDISARDAHRLLSTHDDAPGHRLDAPGIGGLTRRSFLQAIAAGAIGGGLLGATGREVPWGEARAAFAAAPLGPTDGILVTIMLYGGNDGLNMVVPYTDGSYYSQRPRLAIPAETVLPIDGEYGFHPSLGFLSSQYAAGTVALVQGVGYPSPDLSHFTSMGTWMSGRFGGGAAGSGWLGRWLDGVADGSGVSAVTIDTTVPLHLVGERYRAAAISVRGGGFGTEMQPRDQRMYDGLRGLSATSGGRGTWHDLYASTFRTQLDVASASLPAFAAPLPGGKLADKLTIAARLLNAEIGLRVVDVGLQTFDTHSNQAFDHDQLMRELDAGLRSFFDTLAPDLRNRVTLLTLSEFGRTSWANDSGGTDHGTASTLLVVGDTVRGGMYGEQPSLSQLGQWNRLEHTVDFRAVLGSVIDGCLGGGGSTVVGGAFDDLGLFGSGPGAEVPLIVLPPAAPSGFVPLDPVRVFDTRDGTGGRRSPLRGGSTWKVPLAGVAGVPADAVAVAMNLTAVDATRPTYVCAYPAGEARPITSNLNPMPGVATPNLVVVRLGTGGAAALFNNAGSVHLVADVVGYFTPSSTVGLQPLDPSRLLDTRDGTGGRVGPIGQGEAIDLQVAGRGGVAADSVAVLLNVTATDPTAASFLTVWPSGRSRPFTSSVNMAAGQTVPNLVVARLGASGQVSIFNNTGSTNVVVDVLGAFGTGATSRFVSVTPSRALDTRDGIGGAAERIGRNERYLPLAGRCGVPASGVGAVLLNVTLVEPSADTYLTVYPSTRPLPLASNLNARSGQVVPNMVVARLGPDGGATVFNHAGSAHVVADVMGYFTV